jgi:hypothetical protein
MNEKKEYTTLDDKEAFERIDLKNAIVYVNKHYKGPVAIDATVRKENDTHN